MTTYIISVETYSEKAGRLHGHPYTWPVIEKFRGRIPNDEASFHKWLLGIIRKEGLSSARIKIIRPQSFQERPGFHLVWLGTVSELGVVTEKSMRGEVKAVPRIGNPPKPVPWSRQPWYQQETMEVRTRFRRRG